MDLKNYNFYFSLLSIDNYNRVSFRYTNCNLLQNKLPLGGVTTKICTLLSYFATKIIAIMLKCASFDSELNYNRLYLKKKKSFDYE